MEPRHGSPRVGGVSPYRVSKELKRMFWESGGLTPFTDDADSALWNRPPRRSPTTPRLEVPGPDTVGLATRRRHTPVTVASLRLPAAMVDERRAELASRARVLGSLHSLRMWREAHREALIELAREASGIPTGVECAALFWAREGDRYYVCATFTSSYPTVH